MVWKIAFNGAPVTQKAAKRNPLTIRTDPHVRIQIENHGTLFSWSNWLVGWIVGVCTLQQKTKLMLWNMVAIFWHRDRKQWFTPYKLDIHVLVKWDLSKQVIYWSVSCAHIMGSSIELLTKWFLIWLWAQSGPGYLETCWHIPKCWPNYEFLLYKNVLNCICFV